MVTLICAHDCRKASDIRAPWTECRRRTVNGTGSETRGRGWVDDGTQDGSLWSHAESKYCQLARPALDKETQRNRVSANTTMKIQSLEQFSKASLKPKQTCYWSYIKKQQETQIRNISALFSPDCSKTEIILHVPPNTNELPHTWVSLRFRAFISNTATLWVNTEQPSNANMQLETKFQAW